jgi:hypothetical protein
MRPPGVGRGGLLFWLLAMFGCGLDTVGSDQGADTAEFVDRGDPVDYVRYPSDEDNEVLLYSGHGGADFVLTGQVKETWKADGLTVRSTSSLSADLQGVRAIVFVASGSTSDPASPDDFLEEEVSALNRALERGTRLIFLQEAEHCSTDNVTDLLFALEVPMRFDVPIADVGPLEVGAVAEGAQPMANVTTVVFKQPCMLTPGGSWLVRTDDADPRDLAASFRPGNAGDVVLIGDTDFLRQGSVTLTGNDNLIFAQNLAKVVP